jgi:L-cystine uptake protein TcyP (sodium:dicarboxylate symporter family)
MDLETLVLFVLSGAVVITLLLPFILICMGENNVLGTWWFTLRTYFSVMLFLFVIGILFGNSMHHATGHSSESLPDCWEWVDQVNAWVDSIK